MNFVRKISGRGLIAYIHDIVMSGLAFWLAIYLRLGDDPQFYALQPMVQACIIFVGICAVVFWFSGLYRGVWRYASMNDLLAITRTVTIAVFTYLLVMFLWTRFQYIPRSTIPIAWFSLMALLGGPRFIYRIFKDRRFEFENGN
ncbi:MAG: polysaccharide biosynthesis protein, partial [Rhodospirillales bacterium]